MKGLSWNKGNEKSEQDSGQGKEIKEIVS